MSDIALMSSGLSCDHHQYFTHFSPQGLISGITMWRSVSVHTGLIPRESSPLLQYTVVLHPTEGVATTCCSSVLQPFGV